MLDPVDGPECQQVDEQMRSVEGGSTHSCVAVCDADLTLISEYIAVNREYTAVAFQTDDWFSEKSKDDVKVLFSA